MLSRVSSGSMKSYGWARQNTGEHDAYAIAENHICAWGHKFSNIFFGERTIRIDGVAILPNRLLGIENKKREEENHT